MRYLSRVILTISIVIATISTAFAQNVDSLRAFYPLHLGDVRTYHDQTADEFETHEIVGDTLINGHQYFIFHVTWSNNFAPDRYFFRRINDSLWVIEYLKDPNDDVEKEVTVYRLNAQIGESWDVLPGFTTSLDSIGQFHLFDSDWRAQYFSVFNGFFTHQEVLAESLGFVARFGQGEISTTILEGAIINDEIFGNINEVQERPNTPPTAVELHQNYPNPFNSGTTITYKLSKGGDVRLEVVNLHGRVVKTLVSSYQAIGEHKIRFHGNDESGTPLASGVYFYRLVTSVSSKVRKLLTVR